MSRTHLLPLGLTHSLLSFALTCSLFLAFFVTSLQVLIWRISTTPYSFNLSCLYFSSPSCRRCTLCLRFRNNIPSLLPHLLISIQLVGKRNRKKKRMNNPEWNHHVLATWTIEQPLYSAFFSVSLWQTLNLLTAIASCEKERYKKINVSTLEHAAFACLLTNECWCD